MKYVNNIILAAINIIFKALEPVIHFFIYLFSFCNFIRLFMFRSCRYFGRITNFKRFKAINMESIISQVQNLKNAEGDDLTKLTEKLTAELKALQTGSSNTWFTVTLTRLSR